MHPLPSPSRGAETRNLIIAVVLSTAILAAWQFLYEGPRRQAQLQAQAQMQAQLQAAHVTAGQPGGGVASGASVAAVGGSGAVVPRAQALAEAAHAGERLAIRTPSVSGSLALTGLRFDDLILRRYRQDLSPDSPAVALFSPGNTPEAHFADFGWLAADGSVPVPGAQTVWTASAAELTPDQPVTLHWDNGQGLRFLITLTVDQHYMFTLTQSVENSGERPVTLTPFGRISHARETNSPLDIVHQGALGVFDQTLMEVDYGNWADDGVQMRDHMRGERTRGWLGISDKYWFSALIPDGTMVPAFRATPRTIPGGPAQHRFQADYMGEAATVAPGAAAEHRVRLFAGAKELGVLEAYREAEGADAVPLFDRAVDFGILYFLTKPMFVLLDYFYALVGNFGIAILILTVIIKLALYPLANKSYVAISHMKEMQPEMLRIRERYAEDKVRMQQEIMELYKREKVNPAAGCLPIIMQIPIFFALYKVLMVTIEMRHAPFFGWIQDLSAPDPTSLFTLFGLLPWSVPGFLQIGIWPVLMCLTMVLQQAFNPKPSDPVQEKMLKLMPYMFLFLLAHFPAGLVIYWTWSNLLSIAQQWVIARRFARRKAMAA